MITVSDAILPAVPPLWYQLPSWRAIDNGAKYKIISYPRRHGKDFEDISLAARDCMTRKGSYYYVFPTRKWAKRAIWDTIVEINGRSELLIDFIFPKEIVEKKNETDLFVETKNGSRLFMGGTDNLDFIGQGGQGYTMSEFPIHKEEVTSLLAPIIRQSQAYLRLNGTMRGRGNQFYKIFDKVKNDPAWFSNWLMPEQTKLYCWVGSGQNINPELLQFVGKINPKTGYLYKNVQGVPFYNVQDDIDSGLASYAYSCQEYLNEAISIVEKSYYGRELEIMKGEGRILPIDMSREPVYTFWDLGYSDLTSITFMQQNGDKWDVIDYYEKSGEQIEHFSTVLNSRGYKYGGHFAPHDLSQKKLFGDLISKAQECGIEFTRVPKTKSTLDDIELCRRQLTSTRIDEGLVEFLEYMEKYRESPTGNNPVHDASSNCADSFRTFVMAKHLDLIKCYLKSGRRYTINLPDSVSETAEEYCEESGFFGNNSSTTSNHDLWG